MLRGIHEKRGLAGRWRSMDDNGEVVHNANG